MANWRQCQTIGSVLGSLVRPATVDPTIHVSSAAIGAGDQPRRRRPSRSELKGTRTVLDSSYSARTLIAPCTGRKGDADQLEERNSVRRCRKCASPKTT